MNPTTANRLKLIALIALFAVPIGTAHWLTAIGWHPKSSKAYGELLTPPQAFSASDLGLETPSPQPQWTLMILQDPDCRAACEAQINGVMKAHEMLGRHRPALRLARAHPSADAHANAAAQALATARVSATLRQAFKPTNPDTISALLLDPRNHLVMRYEPGFDASGLRRDLGKLVHHNPNSKTQ